ncbi:ABC transporter permease [Rufibacter roseolus]|uniref:ABC transporter permease n=1 Tax=Rufibacter roseolus TaxID=2817375 RepID=UPI001B30EB38|nr:ABC transporter permease [Rufibacter roseolus]
MFKNYLKVAWRNLVRQKIYSTINIAGLTIGITACILISLYVLDEFSYDRYHANADRIYRVTRDFKSDDGSVSLALGHVAPPFGPLIEQDFPDIEKVARVLNTQVLVEDKEQQKAFNEKRVYFAEPNLLDIFTIPMLKGDGKKALTEPYTLLMSDAMAEKYYPGADPVGKVLQVFSKYSVKVGGVYKAFPANSHMHPDFLVSFNTLADTAIYGAKQLATNFGNNSFGTYLLLPKNYPAQNLQAAFPAFLDKHLGGSDHARARKPSEFTTLHLQKVTDVHLRSHLDSEEEPNGDIKTVMILSAVALFILLIACINYINLCTARSTSRAKEIGIRKVVGAHQQTLVGQFLMESILVAILSTILALGLAEALLPWLNNFTGKTLDLDLFSRPYLLGIIVLLPLVIGGMAGLYPAVYLSKFRPVLVLKGSLSSGARNPFLRKTLVVAQFSISIVLIIATGVISQQLNYMQNKALGFDKERLVVFNFDNGLTGKYDAFRNDLVASANIQNVGRSLLVPSNRLLNSMGASVLRGDSLQGTSLAIRFVNVDHDLFQTYGVKLAAGRNFLKDHPTDTASFILNESSVRMIGWKSPQEAIGQVFKYGDTKGHVIGVVRDFHFESMHEAISPMVYLLPPNNRNYSNITVKFRGDPQEALAHIQATWKKFLPSTPFEYQFMDDMFGKLYEAEVLKQQIFTIFAAIAIFIACLGLFGLASYTAEQRTKEIGIRKVLGSSVREIIMLLSKDFALLVVIAIALASPIAWYSMDRWLEDFAYRVPLNWSTFILTGLIAMTIAMLTVSFHAAKAAFLNPVKALRTE